MLCMLHKAHHVYWQFVRGFYNLFISHWVLVHVTFSVALFRVYALCLYLLDPHGFRHEILSFFPPSNNLATLVITIECFLNILITFFSELFRVFEIWTPQKNAPNQKTVKNPLRTSLKIMGILSRKTCIFQQRKSFYLLHLCYILKGRFLYG